MNIKISPKTARQVLSIIGSLALYFTITALILSAHQLVMAQALNQDLSQALQQIGNTTKLPGYEAAGHAQSSYAPGAGNITSAILYVTDLFKYIMGTIAVLVIIFLGIKLITAGKKIDEVSSKAKEGLKYAIIGLIVIMLADTMVKNVFYGEQGEVVKSVTDAQLAAQRGAEQIKGLYNFIEYFLGAIAVLMIVISGLRLVTAFSKTEEQITKARKQIMWAIAGLIVVGLSEFLVKDIVFPKEGTSLPSISAATTQIIVITNFITSFVATAAIGFIMYGGFLYATAMGDPTKAQKAKKLIMGAVIGLVLTLGAYALVNTFLIFKPVTSVAVGTQQTQ